MRGSAEVVQLLLEAAPETAEWKDGNERTPLMVAMLGGHVAAARCLVEASWQPTGELLMLLASYSPASQPLYASLVARQTLTAAQWDCVPTPCAGLGGRPARRAAALDRRGGLAGTPPDAC